MITTASPTTAAPPDLISQGIGRRLLRTEDERLLKGQGRYTDDHGPADTLAVAFLRSTQAHARIRSIDVERAARLPGVHKVLTGVDVAKYTEASVTALPPVMVMEMLPTEKVRYHGDLVAAVVADTRYIAEDALELIDVEYDTLPAVVDIKDALAADAPIVADEVGSNHYCCETHTSGDVEEAFKNAHHVVSTKFTAQRMTHTPMETRGILAEWDSGRQRLTVTTGQQTPHLYRSALATRLRLQESQVRVISPDVGGGFGQKIPVYREDVIVALAAIQLGRPVKWIEDRVENLMAAAHSRDDSVEIEAAVTADGRILGLRAKLWANYGAYSFFGPRYPIDSVGWLLPGVYKVAALEYEVNVVLTNKCPVGTLRAPMAIVTWVTEGTIEKIAKELELDPVEVRLRNMVRANDQPYRAASGYMYEALTPQETLVELLRGFDMVEFRERQSRWCETGMRLGMGIACVLEPTTYGSKFYKDAGGRGSGHETATVRINPDGSVQVTVGIAATGQGYETSLAQMVADALGCAPNQVRVLLGDTDVSPYGMGSKGSRGAAAGHGVAYLAAQQLRQKLDRLRAHLDRTEGMTAGDELSELARVAHLEPSSLPPGMAPGLEAFESYDPPPMTFSNAAHLCVVELDVVTGHAKVIEYQVVEDAGTLINPLIVDGQIRGGVVLGIGQALLEEIIYDDMGNNQSSTLMDYNLPTMDIVPPIQIRHLETPNPWTIRGIKGMAEGPVQGSLAAVMLAINDALAQDGAMIQRSPASPTRVLTALMNRNGDADA